MTLTYVRTVSTLRKNSLDEQWSDARGTRFRWCVAARAITDVEQGTITAPRSPCAGVKLFGALE